MSHVHRNRKAVTVEKGSSFWYDLIPGRATVVRVVGHQVGERRNYRRVNKNGKIWRTQYTHFLCCVFISLCLCMEGLTLRPDLDNRLLKLLDFCLHNLIYGAKQGSRQG